MIKHTIEFSPGLVELKMIIDECGLDMDVYYEYDHLDTYTYTLHGDPDHIAYLVKECL